MVLLLEIIMELRTGNTLNNQKNPECKSPGFFLFLQITFHLQSEGCFSRKW